MSELEAKFHVKTGITYTDLDISTSGNVTKFNKTNTELVSENVQDVIVELDNKIEETNQGLTDLSDSLNGITTDLGTLRFGIDTSGNYGYKKVGADTVIPFKTTKTHTAYANVRLETDTSSTAWIRMTVTLVIDGVAYVAYPKTQTGLVNHKNGDVDARNTNIITFTDK